MNNKEKLMKEVLRFLADLNGCEWIKGDGPGEIDMRQRAKALQRLVFEATRRPSGDAE